MPDLPHFPKTLAQRRRIEGVKSGACVAEIGGPKSGDFGTAVSNKCLLKGIFCPGFLQCSYTEGLGVMSIGCVCIGPLANLQARARNLKDNVRAASKNTTSAELPRRPWDASGSSHWGRFLEFPLLSSFDGLSCDPFLFTGCFLKFILAPVPSAPRYKLAPHNLACVIVEDFVQHTFSFLCSPYHGLPRVSLLHLSKRAVKLAEVLPWTQ